jgi:hypothetical protein
MKKKNTLIKISASLFCLVLLMPVSTVDAQQAKYKMTTNIPVSITTPDVVETSLGTLNFFDGFPDEATVQKVYDNLDLLRSVQVFLTAMPAASFYSLREGIRTFGPDNETAIITESLMDSKMLIFGGNTETVYGFVWANTQHGPLVIEIPPDLLGFINDFWGRYVGDFGRAGKDKGKGGKYLLLPPGYNGVVPDGYFVLQSPTFGNLILLRGFLANGDPGPAVENFKRNLRVYQLANAANPSAMKFVNVSGKYFNTLFANDVSFFDQVDRVVQEEPLDAIDPETRGLLASIGIKKGGLFTPDARMKSILTDAAAIGNATGRTLVFSTRNQDAYLYPNSWWKQLFLVNDYQFSPDGILNLDARTTLYYIGWGVTPAMMVQMTGIGSQYAITERDASGTYLDGSKNYTLHLPPDIPVKDFWSVLVYDPQTRSELQTDQQFPSLNSQRKDLIVNPDASLDIYFGPKAPPGMEKNWIQTIPGKGWYAGLRLYGPLDAWFDKTWRPGEIELLK